MFKVYTGSNFSLFLPPWICSSEFNKSISSKFCINCIKKENIKGNNIFYMQPPFDKNCDKYLSEIVISLNKGKYIDFEVKIY